MKKTYIKPENTVIQLSAEQMVCESTQYFGTSASTTSTGVDDVTPEAGTQGLAREVIQAPDAWEEW